MFAEVLCPNVGELVLRLHVVNGDRVVLDQLLDEEVKAVLHAASRRVTTRTSPYQRRQPISGRGI